MLEERKPKSWLKSISAFANGLGGSLFFGIANDGAIVGLKDIQHAIEVISSKIRDCIDPLPEVELIPHSLDSLDVLEVKVYNGHYTPYYYIGDGQRLAFIRTGDESMPAAAEQLVRLVLKGSNQTFDSLHTGYVADDFSFSLLGDAFELHTGQTWDKKLLRSFGLVTIEGKLTNAGALFADNCPLWQSRLYCTKWRGSEKTDAINDAEFTGNILMLLREALNFVKANTISSWTKLPRGRKDEPEYAERAVFEALVNHFIHRDYTIMGAEVHLDIYDNRLSLTSPGGMYNGLLIQDLDISEVASERRNPILANTMAQLGYMEKRGSGLARICSETKALRGYNEQRKPSFSSTPAHFQTTIYAAYITHHGGEGGGEGDGEMTEIKLSDRQQHILAIIRQSPTISGRQMAETLSVSQRTIERDLATMRARGIIAHEGKDNAGLWVVLI